MGITRRENIYTIFLFEKVIVSLVRSNSLKKDVIILSKSLRTRRRSLYVFCSMRNHSCSYYGL